MIVLIVLSVILQVYLCYNLYTTNAFHKVLTLSVIFYSVIWIIIPGVIALLLYFDVLEKKTSFLFFESVSSDYIILYSLESTIFIFAVAVGVLLKNKFHVKVSRNKSQPARVYLFILLIGFSLIIGIKYIVVGNVSYLEGMDASAYSGNAILALLYIPYGILEAALIYVVIVQKDSRLIILILFIPLLIAALIGTSQGSRISMLLPISVYFYRMHFQSRGSVKQAFKAIIISVLVILVLVPVAIRTATMRSEGTFTLGSIIERSDAGKETRGIAASLFIKFNRFSSGLDLINGYGAGSAGIQPYIGAALIFAPRFIFPDRPVAGSVDGTIYGTPARLVPRLYSVFQNSETMNVGVSPFAISVWQFGWLFGGVILVISGAFYLLLLQLLLTRNRAIYKMLAIYFIGIPTFMGVYNSPDILLKNAVMIAFFSIAIAITLRVFVVPFERHKNHITQVDPL